MLAVNQTQTLHSLPSWAGSDRARWAELRSAFLMRVNPAQAAIVSKLLQEPRLGGQGLRQWLHRLALEGGALPERIPAALVQVYIEFPEAQPLHDCAGCGVAIPIEVGRIGTEVDPQRQFFPVCPCCDGETGLHAYWMRDSVQVGSLRIAEGAANAEFGSDAVVPNIRQRRPR